jgi:pimeloyl-ACP methyl ester carboxylesterase
MAESARLKTRLDVNGVGIATEVHGEGQPVIMLHGFPDSGRLWRNQVPVLAEAGFQVIVPDLRGFGASDKPEGIDQYAFPALVGDVIGVLDHLGVERAHFVGHDWGAALGWAAAALMPERVDHLVALSVGHLTSYANAGFEQLEKAWYILLFQFPGIAEEWLSNDGWANFRAWAPHPDADAVIAELEATGALTPGLNWYRANLPPERFVEPGPELPTVQAPTLGVWSSGDVALTEAQMTGSEKYVSGSFRYERIDGAGHWMQLEAPDEVNRLLLDFLPH